MSEEESMGDETQGQLGPDPKALLVRPWAVILGGQESHGSFYAVE